MGFKPISLCLWSEAHVSSRRSFLWMIFQVAQMVKNLPAMQETWVRSLGWEDPLEKGKATHSSIKKVKVAQLCPTLCHPMDYWSG